ncbi:MAG: hypothetical protein JWN14_4474 [Chthonomonadales bacterium]|nr:hypothetical protein [Chthonomonadales bacterium]
MTDRNPASDESHLLAARTAELAANSHTRQRREWHQFTHREAQRLDARRRAADTAWCRIKVALVVFAVCVSIPLAHYGPRILAGLQRRAVPLHGYRNRPR